MYVYSRNHPGNISFLLYNISENIFDLYLIYYVYFLSKIIITLIINRYHDIINFLAIIFSRIK